MKTLDVGIVILFIFMTLGLLTKDINVIAYSGFVMMIVILLDRS